MKRALFVVTHALTLAGLPALCQARPLEILWWTVDAGGALYSTGGAYTLGSTAGQPDAGLMAGGQFTLQGGFWAGSASSCGCDWNHDTFLNSQDFFDYLTGFFGHEPSADYNADGVVNSQDFFDFLACFFGGCA